MSERSERRRNEADAKHMAQMETWLREGGSRRQGGRWDLDGTTQLAAAILRGASSWRGGGKDTTSGGAQGRGRGRVRRVFR